MSLADLSAGELRGGFARRDFSSVEAIGAVGTAREPVLNAFTTLALERAHVEAVQAERE